ncbi:hypothetical protein BJX66DRAFT_349303 [Aspergillus keveii]|uniref:Fe2OG dioxygenase domain-containing protein n=1 Tax=Aspergillus keveii TaxID=714993 RepID=A0ABR4FK19_9EURO
MSPPIAMDADLPRVQKPFLTSNKPDTGFLSSQFDSAKHIAFASPSTTLRMEDLGLESTALSSVATTEPFPLLSHESVIQHRRELFSDAVLDNCLHHTRPGSVQLRGMAPRYCTIHPQLVPALDYEIAHTNVQLGPGGVEGVKTTPEAKAKDAIVTDQAKPIIEWHRDSHPFVCVVMLSDARFMAGGETELMKGDGSTLKVKAPQMGCAVLLQGRYITHTAAPVTNMPERVTIVTSFRPKDPTMLDEMTNANIRNKSHLSELYYQWTTYRLDVLAARARIAADALRKQYDENVQSSDPEGQSGLCRVDTVDYAAMQKWANEQLEYIQQTLYEMRPLDQ